MSGSRMNMNRPGNDLDLVHARDRHRRDYNNFDRRSRQGHWMRRMRGNFDIVSGSGS